MNKVAIVTDSASDIPFDMQQKYNIDILPFIITVDGKSYVERKDFNFEEYYDILLKCEGIPSTAHITTFRFLECFCNYDDEGYTDVLYISINSGASNTHNAAKMAADEFLLEERPNSKMRIHVIDSKTYSMTYGWYVCKAAEKIQNGASVSEVITYLEDAFSRVQIVLSVFTLNFIKKSGRVSAAAAFAGELLGFRPIISMIDGVTKTEKKVRGDNAVMPGLVEYLKANLEDGGDYMIGATDMENCNLLEQICKKELKYPPVCKFLLGAAVATNTGPNAVAFAFTGQKRT